LIREMGSGKAAGIGSDRRFHLFARADGGKRASRASFGHVEITIWSELKTPWVQEARTNDTDVGSLGKQRVEAGESQYRKGSGPTCAKNSAMAKREHGVLLAR